MKQCPKCKTKYSDPTLEFCLEDGVRLVLSKNPGTEFPTETIPNKPNLVTAENTIEFPSANPIVRNPPDPEISNVKFPVSTLKVNSGLERGVAHTGERILETAPIVIALAHNWWQWVYLDNQYYSSFSSYVFSANFLMWLLLLVSGAVVSLLTLKRSENKGFAISSLVVLAINLLLFIVPRR